MRVVGDAGGLSGRVSSVSSSDGSGVRGLEGEKPDDGVDNISGVDGSLRGPYKAPFERRGQFDSPRVGQTLIVVFHTCDGPRRCGIVLRDLFAFWYDFKRTVAVCLRRPYLWSFCIALTLIVVVRLVFALGIVIRSRRIRREW